ncbi:hypothetical protein B0H13DRAFT_1877424 [Mycena leptocephala]|nr:hypothetical protein B0H13DRAFT_1877424 [Mycena leptocephala]
MLSPASQISGEESGNLGSELCKIHVGVSQLPREWPINLTRRDGTTSKHEEWPQIPYMRHNGFEGTGLRSLRTKRRSSTTIRFPLQPRVWVKAACYTESDSAGDRYKAMCVHVLDWESRNGGRHAHGCTGSAEPARLRPGFHEDTKVVHGGPKYQSTPRSCTKSALRGASDSDSEEADIASAGASLASGYSSGGADPEIVLAKTRTGAVCTPPSLSLSGRSGARNCHATSRVRVTAPPSNPRSNSVWSSGPRLDRCACARLQKRTNHVQASSTREPWCLCWAGGPVLEHVLPLYRVIFPRRHTGQRASGPLTLQHGFLWHNVPSVKLNEGRTRTSWRPCADASSRERDFLRNRELPTPSKVKSKWKSNEESGLYWTGSESVHISTADWAENEWMRAWSVPV